jgi:hypothetical protein
MIGKDIMTLRDAAQTTTRSFLDCLTAKQRRSHLAVVVLVGGVMLFACGDDPMGLPPIEPRVDSVNVSPNTATLWHGQTQQFTCVVYGQNHDQSGIWSASYGEISNDGLYTALST